MMTVRRRFIAGLGAALIMLGLAPATPAGQTVELTIDTGGLAWHGDCPITGGIPIARGALKDVRAVRLMIQGAEVPAQARALAQWPDGSVKWLLLSLVAPADARPVVEFGAGVSRRDVPRPLRAVASGGEVTIDTGVIRFAIRKDGSALIDDLWLDPAGDGKYADSDKMVQAGDRANFFDYIHLKDPSQYPVLSRTIAGEPDRSQVQIEDIKLEESGPIRAVVRIRGSYRFHKLGSTIPQVRVRGQSPFALRLIAYRGSGMVQVEHFFVYEGDPDYDFLRAAGLEIHANLDPKTTVVSYATAAERKCLAAGDGPLVGLWQDNPDHFQLYQATERTLAEKVVAEGPRFEGMVDVSDARWGVAVSHRRMWQNYATGIGVDARRGRVTAWLWPPEANVLDFRRYAREWGVGETGAENHDPAEYARFAAKGCGKTHSLVFHFHKAGAAVQDLLGAVQAFEQSVLLKASPEYYAQTRALGRYRPVDRQHFPQIEAYISNTLDLLLDSQERFRWYGFFNYGCIQSGYNMIHRQGRWDSDFGRWGWASNDGMGRFNHAFMLQYLRSGDRRYFDEGEAFCLINYDTWMVHTREYFWDFGGPSDLSGNTHRHNVQPFGCPFVGARGSYPTGMKIYYYLTGSGRAADGLDEVLATAVDFLHGKGQRLGHCAAGPDGYGTACQSLLCAWERTGDKTYEKALLRFLKDPPYVACLEPKDAWNASMAAAFGMYQAAMEYYDLTGDKDMLGKILKMARICSQPSVKKSFTYPGGYFRILGDSYLLTGEKEFHTYCQDAIAALLKVIAETAAVDVPPQNWPAPPGGQPVRLEGNSIRDLPYLMEALTVRNQGKNP